MKLIINGKIIESYFFNGSQKPMPNLQYHFKIESAMITSSLLNELLSFFLHKIATIIIIKNIFESHYHVIIRDIRLLTKHLSFDI